MYKNEIKDRLNLLLDEFSLVTADELREVYRISGHRGSGLLFLHRDYVRIERPHTSVFFTYEQIREIERRGNTLVFRTDFGEVEMTINGDRVIFFPEGVVLRHYIPEPDLQRINKPQARE